MHLQQLGGRLSEGDSYGHLEPHIAAMAPSKAGARYPLPSRKQELRRVLPGKRSMECALETCHDTHQEIQCGPSEPGKVQTDRPNQRLVAMGGKKSIHG